MKSNHKIRTMFGSTVSYCHMVLLPFYFFILLLSSFASCSVIDEDQSDCGKQAKIDYELRLVTNMTTEIETQLTTETDSLLAESLRDYLSEIFTDFAHDVDLSFYETKDDSVRLHHDQHIMDANQASYTLSLPMREYMHLATANIYNNRLVSLENDNYCHPSMLYQLEGDTIDSHTTGIFTARQPMDVIDGVDQEFNVHLYMANCAAMLVIDPRGHNIDGVKVYATGFATGFHICDSAFVFPDKSPIVTTTVLKPENGNGERGYCCVTFPSREPSKPLNTRTVIETEEPFLAEEGEESLWQFRVYVPVSDPNGTRAGVSITENILDIKESQRAGELKILKVYMGENGVIETDEDDSMVMGVSVTLDWKPGNIFNPTF